MKDIVTGTVKMARMLGLEYYDGPMSGVGQTEDRKAYYFTIVAWDEEHLERVFAVAEIPGIVADRVWKAFEAVEPPRFPKWYPQSDGVGATRDEVTAAVALARAESKRAGFTRL